ncbi:unnamed protein product [Arabis nemorensis]|uniref:Retrotransposon gag domain-containing protein n=1 Tax=Arabis nemorensis TaxID=586526 RepID=A0A565BU53_9BRAS|nr:unnamed protein product [Arabis nemorensis]
MSASPSEGITASPTQSHPPDPPDLRRFVHESSRRSSLGVDRSPTVPNGLSTRLTRIEFLGFEGSDLRGWIQRCEQYFDLDGTSAERKVKLASLYMTGKASKRYFSYMDNRFGNFPSWPKYVLAVASRFGDVYDDPLAELVSVKQAGESTMVYLEKFENALARVSLLDAHSLSIFLSNMDPHLAMQAHKFEVKTVSAAARIAKVHENELLHTPKLKD